MATTKKALAKARTDGAKPNTREHKEQARIDAVAGEPAARSDGPPMRLKMVDGVLQVTFTTRYARARMFDTMSGLVGGGSSKSQPNAGGTGVGAKTLTSTVQGFGAEGTYNPIVA